MRQPILSAVAFLFVVAVALGCVGADDGHEANDVAKRPSVADRNSALRASPDELVATFKADTVSADIKYKDKWVRIIGEVDQVLTDHLGNSHVSLKSSLPNEFVTIHCYLRDEFRDEAAAVCPGQTVTILGKYAGHASGFVFKDCELVKWPESPQEPGAGPADFGESP